MKITVNGRLRYASEFKNCKACNKPMDRNRLSDICYECRRRFLMSLNTYVKLGSVVRVLQWGKN